jgi:hypothetical protein
MSGDNLTIVLFLIGTAVSLAAAAISAAGWRHPLLIRGLLALAAIVAGTGIAWPFLGYLSPRLSVFLSEIATSPVAWFVIIIIGVVAPFSRLSSTPDGSGAARVKANHGLERLDSPTKPVSMVRRSMLETSERARPR